MLTSAEQYARWLDAEVIDYGRLQPLLAPLDAAQLQKYPADLSGR
jgi:hypothetical protein